MNVGAWINAATGQFAYIDEHADWIKRPGNATKLGLPDDVWQAVRFIPNDYGGLNREKILLTVMAAGGIRMRCHGTVIVFEFTVGTMDALRACRGILSKMAGAYTTCRFNNLAKEEFIEVVYSDFEAHIERDIEWILGLATIFPQSNRPQHAR
jgi:hypothetical protein